MPSWYFLLLCVREKLPDAKTPERSLFKNKIKIPAQLWIPEPSRYAQ